MRDMTPDDLDGQTGTPHTLIYHDGSTRTVYTVNKEVHAPPNTNIVSRADLEGNIVYVNEALIELSGYPEEELIGQPHSLLRHPDMPAAAFEDMWKTISKGEKWFGLVKNLRRDGKFYWVHASVLPIIESGNIVGYTSVRRTPKADAVAEAEAQYATLLV